MGYSLEPMMDKDRKPVIDIFNHYVRNSFEAYPETPVGYEFFDRFMEMSKGYPALVAKSETGDVVGFAFLHPHRPISSFKRTAEITYFILPEHTRKGLGRTMLDHLVEQARPMGVDNLLAHVSSLNEDSLQFHRKCGFRECGKFREIGRKFGKSFDVVWMQKRI